MASRSATQVPAGLPTPAPGSVLHLLVSPLVWSRHGQRLQAVAGTHGRQLRPIHVGEPSDDQADIAFFSRDLYEGSNLQRPGPSSLAFFEAAMGSERLGWLQVCSSGTDLPDYRLILERTDPRLVVTTGAGSTAQPIALNVLTAILAFERGFPSWLQAQAARRWQPHARDALPRDISTLHAVVVGTGAIGSAVARGLRGIGMRVTGVRQSRATHLDFDAIAAYLDLDDLLPNCDWLVLACPLTETTRGLVGERQLERLAPGAGLANVARGAVLDETALLRALTDGRLAHAYLDVFGQEPLPPQSPLWGTPGVWITPHNASACAGHEDRVVDLFADNLGRRLRGETLVNLMHR